MTELAVDAGIALALLLEFRKARGILIESQRCTIWRFIFLHGSRTSRVLDRLTAVTIQSGAAAATLAGATLIA